MRNRIDSKCFTEISRSLSVDPGDVGKVVISFFDSIVLGAKALPFDNCRKIYSKDVFDTLVTVSSIPYIGRIGPVYSRYLKWRANASCEVEQRSRKSYKHHLTKQDIESIADAILSGREPVIEKKKYSELFNRVWIVGKDGKKQARQVIPKK